MRFPAAALLLFPLTAAVGGAQQGAPIAIVPVDSSTTVTGALEIDAGRAMIGASGTVTAGAKTTEVILPYRGVLRVCASTTVKLTSDMSVPAGEAPGLVISLDRGALEASFATGQNADVLLTPDFRILIGGLASNYGGAADVKVRLGEHGDTCVDNAGTNAPYVLVSSVFEGGAYRVQTGERVMFQHGSVREAVTGEKESCGCPPEARPGTNEFPVAQSEGIGPGAPPVVTAPQGTESKAPNAATVQMEHNAPPATEAPQGAAEQAAPATQSTPTSAQPPAAQQKPPQKKQGFFARLGGFFRRLFGAE